MAKTNKGRKFFATTATAALVASAIVPVASAAQVNDFNSIASYAQEAVQDLVDRGVVQGDANGNFQPRKSVSRAEAATILTGALGLTTSEQVNFTDVKSGAWYYDAINAAVNNGVFSGKGAGIFEPNGNLTRGEAAIILVNAFNLDGRASLAQFSDEKSVKAWAVESLEIAVGNGVIKGDNGKIKANDAITKQDFAVMFSRAEAAAEAVATTTVKVINATTVEVTFPEAVGKLDDLNFAIDGLTISNKAVKQSNNKTVVLTTSAQTAGTVYTVNLNGKAVGKFTGVTQVIPTAVKIVEFTNPVVEKDATTKTDVTTQVGSHTSQQAPVGTQVTLKAQVTVAEGQSKAGIPVTFNIVNAQGINQNPGGALNQPIVVEATTDENGVASYTYTRYASTVYQLVTRDEVQAYATGNPTARDFSNVYWASIQPLTITEVTQGNDLNNGAKKVYKVKLANGANQVINVGFLDNVNVNPDKANKGVTITDDTGRDLSYPGQFTTSSAGVTNNKQVRITLDSKGEATFTLTGSNETVTPFVFVDQTGVVNTDPTVGRFDKQELVAFAPPVKFGKIQNLGLTNDAQGVQKAAAYSSRATVFTNAAYDTLYANRNVLSAANYDTALLNAGGRTYTAVLTDDKGVKAPVGTVVKVKVDIGTALSTVDNTAHVYLADNNAKRVYRLSDNEEINLYTDANGQVSYRLFGKKDSYATPTVFVESGDKAGLDTNDLQKAGEIVYFSDAVINTAKLTVQDKETASSIVADKAVVRYGTVDQNGFNYFDGNEFVTTFQLTTTFATALVNYVDATGAKSLTINAGSSYSNTIAVPSVNGISEVTIESTRGNRVDIIASASRASLPILNASAVFSKVTNEGIGFGQSVTGKVVAIDKVANRILLTNAAGTKTYELNYGSANLVTRNSPNSITTFERDLTVGDELKFTQANDATGTAQFHNYDIFSSAINVDDKAVTVVIADDLATYGSADDALKGYDFAGITIGGTTADKKARVEILGNNVILKNATINGDVYVDARVYNDFTLQNVTVNGNVYVVGGTGTFKVINSTVTGTVELQGIKHIDLAGGSTINKVVLSSQNSIFTGTGTINEVVGNYIYTKDATVTVGTGAPNSQQLVNAEAAKITTAPAIANNQLVLPTVPAGYTVAVKSSSDEAVIKLDGTVVPAETAKTVTVVLEVTKATGEKAVTQALTVTVPAKETEVTGVVLSTIAANGANETAFQTIVSAVDSTKLTGDLAGATSLTLVVGAKEYKAAVNGTYFLFTVPTTDGFTKEQVLAGKVIAK